MQFHVPQFLEVEDKLFGVFTLKQFLYVFGGLGVSYLFYAYLKIYLAIPLIALAIPFSFALAFARPNNRPFIHMVDYFIHYIFSPRLYIWKKVLKRPKHEEKSGFSISNETYVPPLSENKLKDLAWSLDIRAHSDERPKPEGNTSAPMLKDI